MNTNESIGTSVPDAKVAPATSQIARPLTEKRKRFPGNLANDLGIILDQTGKAFAVMQDKGNHYVLAVGGRQLNNIIREYALAEAASISKAAINDINDNLQAYAEMKGTVTSVWRRVAPVDGGIEIDAGDEAHTRFRISRNNVQILTQGSTTLFHRPQHSKPMVHPSERGDYKLLKKYVNLDPISFTLFIAWLTYTLAHPKVPSSKYVILAVLGGQGTGKSLLSRVIKDLIDPSTTGVQTLPTNTKDLSIAAQQSHVLCYDNLRQLSPTTADALCIAATGGSMSSRQLYTDADQQVLHLHVALVLNGIHSFIDQPDLAQRCLPLYLEPLDANNRQSETEMLEALKTDMPAIQRGLFDLIAAALPFLSDVKITNPERMIDFCRWLAAMEKANGAPSGVYQGVYSDALNRGQRDALQDSALGAAILDFSERIDGIWSGTPAQMLHTLNSFVPRTTHRSREWPDNPIALSKRLQSLQAGLLTQGIKVDFARGKERRITIENIGASK
jgi:hypothetical protein